MFQMVHVGGGYPITHILAVGTVWDCGGDDNWQTDVGGGKEKGRYLASKRGNGRGEGIYLVSCLILQ